MRIIQINAVANSGSTGRIAEEIGNVLLAYGHKSYIAYGRGFQPSKSQLIKIGNNWDIYTHGLKTLFLDRHGFGSIKATKELLLQIERIKPDAVGLHNIHGYYLHIELLFNYLQGKNIPVIWTLHDAWSFTGHCTFYDSVGCEKWKTQCDHCPKTKKYPSSYFLDQSKRNYTDKKKIFNQIENLHLVTPSFWLAKEVGHSFLGSKPCKVIHNGIDLELFKSTQIHKIDSLKRKYGIPNSKKILLGVANVWDKRKGFEDFLKLRGLLEDDFHLVLIGLSRSQIKSLPQSVSGIQRTENIHELSQWYAAADIFLNPTYQDNFPTTNIEALACGTPVITYDTGGSPEAIDHLTGEVVRKGDIEGLKSAIEILLARNQEQLKADCRARAERLFDKNDRYQDYLNLYESLIDEKRS